VQQVVGVERNDRAVQRLARPAQLQEIQHAEPARAISFELIGRVAPRGVEQHGLVGEPPVAVARAAGAVQRALAGRIAERKAQSGVEQRRGFPRSRRTEHHIPGQVGRAAPPAGNTGKACRRIAVWLP